MYSALKDELSKIAANAAVRPAPIPAPPKTTIKDVTKPMTNQLPNYSNVNIEAPMAASNTASGSKTVPPPPVQT